MSKRVQRAARLGCLASLVLAAAPVFAQTHPHIETATVYFQKHEIAWSTREFTAREEPTKLNKAYFIEAETATMSSQTETRRFDKAEADKVVAILDDVAKQTRELFLDGKAENVPLNWEFDVEKRLVTIRATLRETLETITIDERGHMKSSVDDSEKEATDEQIDLAGRFIEGAVGYARDSTLWWLSGQGERIAEKQRAAR